MSSDQNLSEPAVAVLLAVAIVLPPVGMVVGIMGIRRAARERSRHAGRWYGAITIVALAEMVAVIGTALSAPGLAHLFTRCSPGSWRLLLAYGSPARGETAARRQQALLPTPRPNRSGT